jgi:putative membrane protein
MLRALFLAPFLLVLIAFALSNPQPVSLALWPTDVTLEAPLSIATLVIAGVFFLLGALIVWLPGLAHRRRARVAERRARSLERRSWRQGTARHRL